MVALDVTDGIDAYDYAGPVVRRTAFRAGVIKVAGSDGGLSPRDLLPWDARRAVCVASPLQTTRRLCR